MPCRRAGMVFLRLGNILASQEKKRQNDATKANCTRVSVAGFWKAFKMDFEDVLVSAEKKYQMIQSIYMHQHMNIEAGLERHTINLGDTGAFKASAISAALALTLALLVLIVLRASLRLFCLPWPLPLDLPPIHFDPPSPPSLFGCQRPFCWPCRLSRPLDLIGLEALPSF
jgi:hypothetical protein